MSSGHTLLFSADSTDQLFVESRTESTLLITRFSLEEARIILSNFQAALITLEYRRGSRLAKNLEIAQRTLELRDEKEYEA